VSFILDALRKSEHERQRSATPGLSHVPLATPRRELPGWVLLVIGVLAAAVLVLGGAWWQSQRSRSGPAPSSQTVVPAPVASTPPTAAAPAPVAAPTIATPPPAAAPATVAIGAPPVQPPAVVVAAATSARDSDSAAALDVRTQSLASAASVPKRPAPTGPTLPSAAALLAQGIDVPPLKLELHAYSDKPAERFVFINGRKYKEGERLTEGPEVVTIEPNGVVLSQRGQRFQLAPE
jgi:general secretion pathway protein B